MKTAYHSLDFPITSSKSQQITENKTKQTKKRHALSCSCLSQPSASESATEAGSGEQTRRTSVGLCLKMDSRRPLGSDLSDRKRLAFLPRCKPGATTKDLLRVIGNPEAMFREVFLDGTWNSVSSCHGLSGRLTLWVHPQGTKQLSSSIARTNKKRASLNEGSTCKGHLWSGWII